MKKINYLLHRYKHYIESHSASYEKRGITRVIYTFFKSVSASKSEVITEYKLRKTVIKRDWSMNMSSQT